MQLSTHTDYSLRTLIHLSLRGGDTPVTVQEIARDYGISANHVAKVAQTLSQLGYVKSLRGRGGGLVLAQSPQAINVGGLVRQTENLKLLECFGPNPPCPIDPACKLKRVLQQAQQAFLEVLDGYTLDQLARNRRELEQLLFKGPA
ncbi:MAG: Rrf2 family transcriptional regulator [Alcanivoracaceae bacterium]|uniref:RrF2 family transcriptional regulator n=1 Tax=Alcanivorax sp. MD8A TaxID=1177157 RepID=UPI000C52F466|nr:Rrf2 family transcriptional regulator [Alcanivorax sp. MD8A]MAX55916.1 Rrf2 family transcriptional regulator [Alcanivoracaceae bacterium]MCG8439480.1 Rrf2 family transcriptional regulator [Pseudomonadales bacterium]PNE04361.1 transcriptional regulator [Alcanivorax sp. MD8A]|tara:strand:- start:2080 stop:2517 length:438 start_codon:yes stop_codon:yes gene_type:complete